MMIDLGLALGIWALAVGCWWVTSRYLQARESARIQSRLTAARAPKKDGGAQPLLRPEDHVTGRIVLSLMRRYNLAPRAEQLLEQAGLRWKAARLAHACLGCFLGGFCFAWRFIPGERLLLSLAVGGAAGFLPVGHVLRLRRRRLQFFEEQFPDALEFIARSMRAGHAFSASLEMIHKEFREPLAGEFKRAFEEHNLGLNLDQSLLKLGQRVPSLDLQFFISAVLLQKRTGGNLAEILEKLAYVIRERFKLRGKIRAISAHGRMTGTALSLIPCVVALLMFWVNPSYVTFFVEDEIGQYLAGGAIGLQLLGYAIIQRIVKIEV